jgi:hypothetical protein
VPNGILPPSSTGNLEKDGLEKKKKKVREALTLCSGEILLRIIVLLIEVAVPLLLAY